MIDDIDPMDDPTQDELPPGVEEPEDEELAELSIVTNLVPIYQADEKHAEWLEREGKKVVKRSKEARESRADFMSRRAEIRKLYAGVLEALKYPAKGGKSAHLSILCRAMLQLWSRLWDAVCPAKGDRVQVLPVGPEDEEAARRRQKHINWQLRKKIEDWDEGHKANILQWLLDGSAFRAKSWDPVRRATRLEHLTVDEMLIPYTCKDVHPLMPKASPIRVRTMHRHELEAWDDEGWIANFDKLFPSEASGAMGPAAGSGLGDDDSDVQQVRQDVEGIDKPPRPDADERVLLEAHYWVKLPDQERMKPVAFMVDSKGTPLRLIVREIDDPMDRPRFEREKQAYDAAVASIENANRMAMAQFLAVASTAPEAPPPPEPVEPPAPPRPIRKKTVYEHVHYRCFENPDGFYGIGAGYLLAGHNELANELSNEYLLSAKFNNLKSGFLARGAFQNQKGPIQLEMGKYKQTDLEAEELDKGIKDVTFGPPSDGLWKFINLLKEDAESLVANVAQLSGEAGPTNETKAAAQMRNYNAMTLISVIARLYLAGMKEEVKLVAQDNMLYLDEQEFFYVTEPNKQVPGGPAEVTQNEVFRDDYANEFDFEFTVDPRLETKPEKIAEINQVIDRIANSPLVQSQQMPPMMDQAFRLLFRAMDRPEMEASMGQPVPPPQPPPPPSPMSQVDENAMFMNDQDHPVMPEDNDMEHYGHIQEWKASPYYEAMSSTGKNLLDKHERAHLAQAYKKEMAARGAQTGGFGQFQPGPPGRGPGMAPGPGNGIPGAPPAPRGAPPVGPPPGVGAPPGLG